MNLRFASIFLSVALLFFACHKTTGDSPISDPEEKLLKVFKDELATLDEFKDKSYAQYLEHQNEVFPQRTRHTLKLIEAINAKYDAMTTDMRISYEEKWQRQFQPVIDDLTQRTRDMATRATADLKPDDIGKIEALHVKRENLEKKAPMVKLKPQFYRIL